MLPCQDKFGNRSESLGYSCPTHSQKTDSHGELQMGVSITQARELFDACFYWRTSNRASIHWRVSSLYAV
jgi:hypothetical protein